jgi:photosystem II stability/assembly factor-like uncharacterized protein
MSLRIAKLELSLVGVLFLALIESPTSQPFPDTLRWELVNSTVPTYRDSTARTFGLAFVGDTLIASTGSDGVLAKRPEYADWEVWKTSSDLAGAINGPVKVINSTRTPLMNESSLHVYIDRGRDVWRSADYGRTWTEIHDRPSTYNIPPTRGPGGALFAGTNAYGNGVPSIIRSTDEGETWEVYGTYAGFFPWALAYTEPTTGSPEGRLVAADARGLVYSHDGGLTWSVDQEWWDRAIVKSITAVPAGRRDGGHAGRFIAAAYLGGENRSAVLASDDGGATWAEVFDHPRPGALLQVFAAPDGTVYAYKTTADAPDLYGSTDGGDTWRFLGRVEATWPPDDPPIGVPDSVQAGGPWEAWMFGVQQLAAGSDGHLYVGGAPEGPRGFDDPGGGVLKTTEPVVLPVAAENTFPSGQLGLGIQVVPNPSGATVTLRVVRAPYASVPSVEVRDMLGRVVLTFGPGQTAVQEHYVVPVGALAPGSYVARVVAGEAAASTLFTVTK